MNFEQATVIYNEVNAKADDASRAYSNACKPHRGAMGLTNDTFKMTSEYRTARDEFNKAFQVARKFNTWYSREFKKELLAQRQAKRAVLCKQ